MYDDPRIALKFSPLTPPLGFIQRSRLVNQLAKGFSGRLTLIKAPMGFGKTSLLSSIAQEWNRYSNSTTATHIAWYTLDPSDNDAAAFIEGLVMAVQQLFPEFGRPVRAFLRGTADARRQLNNLLALFHDELRKTADGDVAIVLDDFHVITDRAIVDALGLSFLAPASRIKWIISTQINPKFYLSPLRSQDGVVELADDDLRFTHDEIRELFLARVRETVTRKVVEEVARETGGWPSAVYLMALVATRGPETHHFDRLFPTQHGYARIARAALAGLPPRYRDAVLRSSLIGYLDHCSCRDGLGLADPEDFLKAIQEMALPIMKPRSLEGPLVFDPLFRSALEQELSKNLLPHEYRKLKCGVASYYAGKGEPDNAIRGFLSVGASNEAADVMEKTLELELEQGHLDLVLEWLRFLPAAIRGRHPRLLVQEARLSLARERLDDARVLLVTARPELEAVGDEVGMGQLLGSWAALYLLEGRYKEAQQSAEDALRRLPDVDAADTAENFWLLSRSLELLGDLREAFQKGSHGLLAAERSGRQTLVIRAMSQLGRLAYLRGDFEESLALNGRAVQRSALIDMEALTLGSSGGIAGIAYLERGQIQEAAVVAARSLEISKQYGDTAATVRAGIALSAASDLLSQREYAQEKLSEALKLSSTLARHMVEPIMVLQAAAGLLRRQGKGKEALSKAQQALRKAIETSNSLMAEQCQLMVAAGQATGPRLPISVMRIYRLCREFKRRDSKRWLSAAQQLLAMGFWQLRLKRFARDRLRQSLELAAKESYCGTPLGLPETKKLLLLAASERLFHEKAGNLLGVNSPDASKILEPLIRSKKPALAMRAREAIEGIDAGMGRAQQVRLLWPGLTESDNSYHGQLLLCAFGQFEAFVDGEPVEWPSSDARNLAAYLLVNCGQPVAKNKIVEDIWPNSELSHANVRIHVALYRLRETLGSGYPAVDLKLDSQQKLLWDGIGCSIDAGAFKEGINRIRQRLDVERPPVLSELTVSLLEEVVRLYRGAFMANVDFDWCRPVGVELRQQFLWAIRILVFHYMAVRDWTQALRCGRRSLVVDPLQEEIVRQMMVCYCRIGDRDAILKQYQDLKWQVAKKRGAWLSEETRNLRLQLLGT